MLFINNEELYGKEWYVNADISDLFARVISRLYQERTLTPLIDDRDIIQRLLKNS